MSKTLLKFIPPILLGISLGLLGLLYRRTLEVTLAAINQPTVFTPEPDDMSIVSTYYYPTSESPKATIKLPLETKRTEFPPEPDDISIVSTYFYQNSRSLGNNSIAMVLTAHYEVLYRIGGLQLLGISSKDNVVRHAQLERITPHNVCPWISMFLTVQMLPDLKSLSIILGEKYYQIPFKAVSYQKREVVTCISPLFGNEQWQYLLLAAHVYKRFGSFMHVYVRSMVDPVYKLLLEYENEDYLKLEPWLRLNLTTIPIYEYNPNINIEFRGQASAQTDCLLQYKESAKFISFMDLDDLLIPRMADNYAAEFEKLFNFEQLSVNRKKGKKKDEKKISKNKNIAVSEPPPEERKKVVAFLHFSKENVHVESTFDPAKFSISNMFSSMYFKNVNETGKMVTRPKYFNHTWIHWPSVLPEGLFRYFQYFSANFCRYDVPKTRNAITHLKVLDQDFGDQERSLKVPAYLEDGSTKPLISSKVITELQSDFERMKLKAPIQEIWHKLPQNFFYLDLITACFNHTFYRYHYGGRHDLMKCPGPDRCRLPKNPGIPCANARADFSSSRGGTVINIHYSKSPRFEIEDGCIP